MIIKATLDRDAAVVTLQREPADEHDKPLALRYQFRPAPVGDDEQLQALARLHAGDRAAMFADGIAGDYDSVADLVCSLRDLTRLSYKDHRWSVPLDCELAFIADALLQEQL